MDKLIEQVADCFDCNDRYCDMSTIENLVAALEECGATIEPGWRPIAEAPRDGTAFYGYGRHITDNGKHWSAGDHFWGIVQWDIWRPKCGFGFVFSKDGVPVWETMTHWRPLPAPPK